MPGVALQDIHTLLAQDTARVHQESSNATESLLRVLDDPPEKPPSQPEHPPQQPHNAPHPHPHPPPHQHLNPPFPPSHNLNHHHPHQSNTNNNMPSPASPNGTPHKSRLTNEQKKKNHIESEKKRRDAIRAGFDRIADIVPGMSGNGRSEAVVLQHTVAYMNFLKDEREALDKMAYNKGIMSDKDRNAIYIKAEEEIRAREFAAEEAATASHQAAQHAARGQMGPPR